MIAEALKYLQDHLGMANEYSLADDRSVFDRPVHNPPRPDLPLPKPRGFSTLSGLAQFITEDPDGIGPEPGWMIHVASPNLVELVRSPNANGERDIRVRVTCPTQEGADWLGKWVSQEDMLIGLLGCSDVGDLHPLIQGVQSIRRESAEVSELADGGQKVSASFRVGLTEWLRTDSSGEGLDLNKVVKLAPFRTFCEIEQPLGLFVFRIRGGEGAGTKVILIPTPDTTWAVKAVQSVKERLDALLRDIPHAPPVVC